MIRKAATVSEFLSELTPDERADIEQVLDVVRQNMPPGYQEGMNYGMICYTIPLERYSTTYNGQALCYAALAAHKSYHTLYLMNVYGHPQTEKWFRERFKASGKKLDMGKSCVHFRRASDLPLDVIGDAIARTSVDDYIAYYEKARPAAKKPAKPATKATQKKTARKAAGKKSVKKKAGKKKR
jgi:hypothetical protein